MPWPRQPFSSELSRDRLAVDEGQPDLLPAEGGEVDHHVQGDWHVRPVERHGAVVGHRAEHPGGERVGAIAVKGGVVIGCRGGRATARGAQAPRVVVDRGLQSTDRGPIVDDTEEPKPVVQRPGPHAARPTGPPGSTGCVRVEDAHCLGDLSSELTHGETPRLRQHAVLDLRQHGVIDHAPGALD